MNLLQHERVQSNIQVNLWQFVDVDSSRGEDIDSSASDRTVYDMNHRTELSKKNGSGTINVASLDNHGGNMDDSA